MINTAIILAGGFGTRLQTVVKDRPKPMADINGKPFLQHLLDFLILQGINNCILSVGFKWETIRDYFGEKYLSVDLSYCVEESPLGTGGAILKAVQSVNVEEFFVFNGDTFFAIDLNTFYLAYKEKNGLLSLALKKMSDFDRYGVVITDKAGKVSSFEEKKYYSSGNINGGVYLLNRKLFEHLEFPENFSFEKDLMEKYCTALSFYGVTFDDYFIDIGIPEDYERAKHELERFTH
ncbi:MAG: nucleotidyltransferase family protein [Chitinophagaceae bacterium]|nr:nucleotidyltransferase family protein [Chitinophagaceae bacterium]